MAVHPHAGAFDTFAAEYERGRPGYPRALLDWLAGRGLLEATCTVIDLGAGTGKLTRLLLESAASVIAVEPVSGMREEFARVLPSTEMIDATAEAMPLEDKSADVVVCGQSFKWFATHQALAEIARVLRPDGELVLVFNNYDPGDPVQAQMQAVQDTAANETVEDKPGDDWRDVVLSDTHFALTDELVLANPQTFDREGVIGRARSSSQFARLAPQRQAELLAGLEALIPGATVELCLLTDVMALRRVAGS